MFSFFKRSTPKEKLQEKYRRLMKESMELSRTDRRMADIKRASADEVLKRLETLEGSRASAVGGTDRNVENCVVFCCWMYGFRR